MNSKLKKSVRPLLVASTLALCVVFPSAGRGVSSPPLDPAQQSDPAVDDLLVSYPPGAVAVFAETIEPREGETLPVVYVTSSEAGGPAAEWLPSTRLVDAAGEGAGKKRVAFTVPQLPRGRYVARHELRDGAGAKETMSLFIEPQLYAVRGVVEGTPGDVVEVEVGIDATFVAGRDGGKPLQRRAHVTLRSDAPAVADLAPGQPASVTTGEKEAATSTWRVRLGGVGAATLTATAPDFETAEVRVIVLPTPTSPAARRMERMAENAEERAASAEDRAQRERANVDELDARLVLAERSASGREKAVMMKKRGQASEALARAETSRAVELRREAIAETTLAALAPAPPAPCTETRLLSFDDLLPGDVLLMTGKKLISRPIIFFERINLGGADYSHAALYVRRPGGGHMVAEMLGDGYNFHELAVSIAGAGRVDVYRWKDTLDDRARERIMDGGTRFAGRAYAWPQIKFLGAAVVLPQRLLERAARNLHVEMSRGERQLICSELVAWAYHHAERDPSAANWWGVLEGYIRDDDELRHDYTTPNMLADKNGRFALVGRLVPRC